MKKLIIVSDNHGDKNIEMILDKREYDLAIHCGDSQFQYNSEIMKKFNVRVKGNCDFDNNYPNEVVIEIEGIKLFITHGHLYNIKYTFKDLCLKADELGCQIALFGHSHQLMNETTRGIQLINSGSTAFSRSQYPNTFLELTLENKRIIETKANIRNDKYPP